MPKSSWPAGSPSLSSTAWHDANMRVRDVVKLGRIPHHSAFSNWSTHDDETVTAALQRVDMLDKSDQGWLSLSGGERQRVHIARALAQTPRKSCWMNRPTTWTFIIRCS
jgi:ABC-type cobalamin/Fe3+-siderophores transport system ATPase subunit